MQFRMSLAAPASVVECIQPAPMFQTASVTVNVTGINKNRDGTPDMLQQPLCSAASLHVSVWMSLSDANAISRSV